MTADSKHWLNGFTKSGALGGARGLLVKQSVNSAAPTIWNNWFFGAAAPAGGGQVKVWDGAAFVAKPVKVWNGSSWVTKPLKRWNGAAWEETTY